jgi:F0F1-type ATP synthase membrane subunit b/b'
MAEILAQVAAEIGGNPARFAIELAQFGLLVGIAYVVLFGFGKRRGMLVNMLSERRRRVAAQVERIAGADGRLSDARREADAIVAEAKSEKTRVVRAARADARVRSKEARAGADSEALTIRARAAAILDEEEEAMRTEVRDRLVGVVAASTRALIGETLTPREQRELVGGVVSAGLDGLERSLVQRSPSGARR